MNTHCRQWVCGHCDCPGISLIFRLTTFDVRIRRQKSSNSANRVFYISLNKGYFGKAIFSCLFSARYHILKKKKKKKKRYWAYVAVVLIITLSILATCLVSSNCSVTHVRWGEGTSSVLFQWRPAFSALWRRGNSVVWVNHINNFWNTRSNLTKFSGQSPQWLRMVCAKLHVKRLGIDWDINEKRSADVVTTLAQCFALLTFKVLNQTPPNLLGSYRSSSRWCLQNYMKNDWELTSELTSKWIYILKYSSKFHTNLINNFWNTRSNFTEFTGQWP